MSFDLLIKNGTVVDGSGGPGYRADVAIARRPVEQANALRATGLAPHDEGNDRVDCASIGEWRQPEGGDHRWRTTAAMQCCETSTLLDPPLLPIGEDVEPQSADKHPIEIGGEQRPDAADVATARERQDEVVLLATGAKHDGRAELGRGQVGERERHEHDIAVRDRPRGTARFQTGFPEVAP